jgi:endonuclease III
MFKRLEAISMRKRCKERRCIYEKAETGASRNEGKVKEKMESMINVPGVGRKLAKIRL